MRSPHFSVACAIALTVAGCGSHAPKPSPSPSTPAVAYRTMFLQHCEIDTTPERANYCECSVDALQAKYPIEKLETLMRDPQMHRAFVAITHRCAAAAGLSVR